MIARLQGIVVEKNVTELVIDCHGVGYVVLVSVATAELAVIGSSYTVHTYLAVREDAMQLFGFRSHEERQVFLHLISISGIGGKTALAIISAASIRDLQIAVVQKNASFLQRLPGIGKKTAERIILELQDKMSVRDIESSEASRPAMSLVQADAVAAMVALGYNRQQAEKAVRATLQDDSVTPWTTDKLLRAALQQIP